MREGENRGMRMIENCHRQLLNDNYLSCALVQEAFVVTQRE